MKKALLVLVLVLLFAGLAAVNVRSEKGKPPEAIPTDTPIGIFDETPEPPFCPTPDSLGNKMPCR